MPYLARAASVLTGILCAFSVSATAASAALPHTRDLATQANVTIIGAAAGDEAGLMVDGAGDVNGDGRQDLLISAPYADNNGRTDSGSVYIVFGQATPTDVDLGSLGSLGYRLDGAGAGDRTAASVANAGDVNGDGKADQVFGARMADANGRTDSGTAYVTFGKASTTTIDLASLGTSGYRIDGAAASDYAGFSVAGAGDVNADGRPDQLVGAFGADNNGRASSGSAYVVFGKTSTTAVDLAALGSGGYRIDGATAGDETAYAVARAGYVNGDGIPDLLINAASADNNSRTDSGSAYVVYGKTSTTTIDLAALGGGGYRIDGAASGDAAGFSVTGVGDVNADGRDDQLIGARLADNNGRADSGSAYVVFGQDSNTPIDLSLGLGGYRIDGALAGGRAGHAVTGLGDVNGDSVPDLLLTAVNAAFAGRSTAGAGYVVFGRASSAFPIDLASLGTGGYVIGGAAAGDQAGWWVASAGDVNADGRNDIAISTRFADPAGRTSAGATYLLHSEAAAPTSSLSHTPVARGDLQHFDGATGTLFYNPAAAGSFTLGNSPSDTGSGVVAVDYSALAATGFSASALQATSAPWSSATYSFTTANAAAPGAQQVVVSDGQGNRTTDQLALVRDTAAPPVAVSTADSLRNGDPLSASATDADAGTASVAFRYCPGASCSWGSGTAIGTADSSAPYGVSWTSQPVDGTYTVVARAADRVGNTADATETVTVDNTAPTASVSVTEGAEPGRQHFDPGTSRLFYNPSGTDGFAAGEFTLAASATDATGVASVAFPSIATAGFTGSAVTDTGSPFTSGAYSFTSGNASAPEAAGVVATDTTGNATTRSVTFVRDMTVPASFSVLPASGTIGEGEVLSADPTDAGAGIDSVSFAYCAGASCSFGSATPIGVADSSAPHEATWAGQPADGQYTIVARATDRVGNVTDATSTVTVDNVGPTGAEVEVIPGTRPDLQHFDSGSDRLYYNPSAAGSFELRGSSPDPLEIDSVDFPAISEAGFTGNASSASSSPFTSSGGYAFGPSNTTAPAPADVVLYDGASNSSPRTLSFTRDTAPPSGGSISYTDGSPTSGAVPISTNAGSDPGSGLAPGSGSIQRRQAPYSGSACGTWGTTWTAVSSADSSTQPGHCYSYRFRTADQVGNLATYTGTGVVRRAPATPAAPEPVATPEPTSSITVAPEKPAASSSTKRGAVPLKVAARSLVFDRRGFTRLPVRCAGTRRCRGKLTVFYYEQAKPRTSRRASRAVVAAKKRPRRRKVVVISQRFNVKAGARTTIKARIARRAGVAFCARAAANARSRSA